MDVIEILDEPPSSQSSSSHDTDLMSLVDTQYAADDQQQTRQDHKKKKLLRPPRYIPLELQKLFTYMQRVDLKTLTTEDLTKKGFQWEVHFSPSPPECVHML
jgi:hypothetical protein